ncbi:hypothetical protein NECAME_16663, partial [Necator americanus]
MGFCDFQKKIAMIKSTRHWLWMVFTAKVLAFTANPIEMKPPLPKQLDGRDFPFSLVDEPL